jgi:phosphohistidine phosphatase
VRLYIVRHAIAAERDAERWPDDRQRPLTERGEQRFRKIARRMRWLAPHIDAVYSSPLARAWRTAEILAETSHWPAPITLQALEPGVASADLLASLRDLRPGNDVAVVGHEPNLHELISLLLAGRRGEAFVEMRKGGMALLELDADLTPGKAHLLWVLPPRLAVRISR